MRGPRGRLALATVLIAAAGCGAPNPTGSLDMRSGPGITLAASGAPQDIGDLVECRQVPEDVCVQAATGVLEGPQPDYARGARVEAVLVTCESLPPCATDRTDSGGKVIILYTNGWAWTQDWAPGGGT